jgi:hypothetical protein
MSADVSYIHSSMREGTIILIDSVCQVFVVVG